jgi:hypothetical protein
MPEASCTCIATSFACRMAARPRANTSAIRARSESSRCRATATSCSCASTAIPHRRDFIEIPAGKLEPTSRARDRKARAAGRDRLRRREVDEARRHPQRDRLFRRAIELWLATQLELRTQALDHGEFLEVLSVPLAEALAMTRDGESPT